MTSRLRDRGLFFASGVVLCSVLFASPGVASAQSDPAPPAPATAAPVDPPATPPVPVPAPPPAAAPAPPAPVSPPPALAARPSDAEVPPAPEPPPATPPAPLPYAMKGGVEAGVSALRFGSDLVPTVVVLGAHVPVATGTFADVRLPLGVGTLGNPQVGMHHARALTDGVWLSVGGSLGLPLVSDRNEALQIAAGMTNLSDFARELMPFAVRAGLEVHASVAELRFQVEPLWGISTRASADHFFAFQHAFEAQVGHTFGAGVRYQGVAFGTNPVRTGDYYQGAVEPFVRAAYKSVLARFGVFFPLDEPLNPSSGAQIWGVNAMLAYQID